MVIYIHILEHWSSLSRSPNIDYLKAILSIPIALGTQLDNDRETTTQ